jgi:hypothetical protein
MSYISLIISRRWSSWLTLAYYVQPASQVARARNVRMIAIDLSLRNGSGTVIVTDVSGL